MMLIIAEGYQNGHNISRLVALSTMTRGEFLKIYNTNLLHFCASLHSNFTKNP